MKKVLSIVFLPLFALFFQLVGAQALILESDCYVTIFDKKMLSGDANFCLIRLYKAQAHLRYSPSMPPLLSYATCIGNRICALKECRFERGLLHSAFSAAVDSYIFKYGFLSVWGSQTIPGQKDTVVSVPGEIIYFNDDGKPSEVEVGAFQYTIDHNGCCYYRRFKLLGKLVSLKVSRVIDDFLRMQKENDHDLLSHYWCKELNYFMQRYIKESGEYFI